MIAGHQGRDGGGTGAIRSVAPWLLITAAVWLGWQIAIQPVMDRTPPAVAIRVAPTSASVLRRSAEAELAAGRKENARALAADSLGRTPFEVRALRTLGLVDAETNPDEADQLLTLAGNWSLRDDPTHAWLIQQRLRQGDYGSAFAHADTLVRRRRDIDRQVFALFTTAASHDPRALRALATRLAERPPWRQPYIDQLYRSDQGYQVAVNLAFVLKASRAPFNDAELHQLYVNLLDSGRSAALPMVRGRLTPAIGARAVLDGDFSGRQTAPLPFSWSLPTAPGLIAEILPSSDENPALRVEYTGASTPVAAQQLIMLPPGEHQLSARAWIESGAGSGELEWSVTCANGLRAGSTSGGPTPSDGPFRLTGPIRIPAQGCPVQWLRLAPKPQLDAASLVVWFDDVTITPIARTG